MFTQDAGAAEESEAARAARRRAEEEAERHGRRCGYAWTLPRWYQIERVQDGELLGSLHAERVSCGKAGCRCGSGREEDLHGPYWYRRWRDEDGRHRKAYVPRRELADVREKIDRRRRRIEAEREARRRHMRRGEYARSRAEEPYKT